MIVNLFKYSFLFIIGVFFIGCGGSENNTNSTEKINLTSKIIKNNKTAYITSQCYTKTVDNNNIAHNPCFSCHINSQKPNFIEDQLLQESYDFSNYSKKNRWSNLFKDRTKEVQNQSDNEILYYVRQDNYKDSNGNLYLKTKLDNLPLEWDTDKDNKWGGYTPDCYFEFDKDGFDKAPNGEYTKWRAFAYYPFLGTFWPTNGSTDDVLIRLPEVFYLNKNGIFDINIAKLNYSILESLIKQKDIKIDSIDENLYGVDLNQNGILDKTDKIVFKWSEPIYDFFTNRYSGYKMYFVGAAKFSQEKNKIQMGAGLYPVGTEFLHSVRYIDINLDNQIKLAPRMKELRYAKKYAWADKRQHQLFAEEEAYERLIRPDIPRIIEGNMEYGLDNGIGWKYQGFIEDKNGDLRPQTYEETMYCMGCHSTIGAIKDSTFVFGRKLDYNNLQNGWYHWSQSGLKNIKEPKLDNGLYEYSFYLKKNKAGDEFRDNKEIQKKFFNSDGSLNENEISKIHNDISHLIFPSRERALELNKAYRVIVKEQSFIYGRDAHIKPIENVHKEVTPGQNTELNPILY